MFTSLQRLSKCLSANVQFFKTAASLAYWKSLCIVNRKAINRQETRALDRVGAGCNSVPERTRDSLSKTNSHLTLSLWSLALKKTNQILVLGEELFRFLFLKLYIIASFSPLFLQYLPCIYLLLTFSLSPLFLSLSNSWHLFNFYIYIKIYMYIYVLFVSFIIHI